jgi:hypothetical protein
MRGTRNRAIPTMFSFKSKNAKKQLAKQRKKR